MRARSVISWLISLIMIGAGVALIASFFLRQGPENVATNSSDPGSFNVPELDAPPKPEEKDVGGPKDGGPKDGGPKDKTLELTIPEMRRVDDATVPDAPGDDGEALDSNTAIHLQGTGFPWEEEANVYVAGHRLGYPNTDSFLAFLDLNRLEDGDKVLVEDADGNSYTYKVFKETVVSPTDLSVTQPVPGKNVLTLQTCTLPDYSERLIVQAERVDQA